MKKLDLAVISYTLVILLSVMYATQPLQPLLSKEFEISMTQASYFTAVIMFSLAIAPIFYGYILERVCAKRVLIRSSFILLVSNILLAFSNSYEMFLTIRFFESLVVPAVLTSAMSILANIDKKNIQFNMSIYVASTVLGGLLGRVFSGLIADEFGWRAVFLALSLTLFIGIFFIKKLSYEGDANLTKGNLKDLFTVLSDKRFVLIYILMFTMFFSFAGILNILPFRIKELLLDASESTIGILYLGYGTGIVVALYSKRIVNFFGTKIKTILVSLAFFILVITFLITTNIFYIFILLFLFCIGMFTIHTVASGLANSMMESKKALTSGIYLTFYYIGGAIGSILPVMIYDNYGWNTTMAMFLLVLSVCFMIMILNKRAFNQ